MSTELPARLTRRLQRLGLDPTCQWSDVVRAVRALPYGRTTRPEPDAVLDQGHGTCSTKHQLLHELLVDGWPDLEVSLVHRVYRLTPDDAGALFGPDVARCVPPCGLTDVHTYLLVGDGDRPPVTIDATFPADVPWDGRSDMALACGPGTDHLAGENPAADKASLVAAHCDPTLREPFIAALTTVASKPR